MNKTELKNFAINSRLELLSRVRDRAALYGITEEKFNADRIIMAESFQKVDGNLLSNKETEQRKALEERIRNNGFVQVMEEAAYTWFNRFIALRYMEEHNLLPIDMRVIPQKPGELPQIVREAQNVTIEGIDLSTALQFLDDNKSEELYKYLIITLCNNLSDWLPQMFEKINDYTELLFPDGLLKVDSFLGMISNVGTENWQDIQVIGWLYQYYNTELKDETFALLKKNVKITKDRIGAATQLFTPEWIVRYMVENSLGRLWYEGHPDDSLKAKWQYYIDEAQQEPEVEEQLKQIREERKKLKPEDIKLLDPCMGSGHILVYAFDVLMQIYRSIGYTDRDAVKSIIENNLYGLDIDDRAAQLAYFALMMKAAEYDKRFMKRGIQPNVCAIQESNTLVGFSKLPGQMSLDKVCVETANQLIEAFVDAKEYGSILSPHINNLANVGFLMKQLKYIALSDLEVSAWFEKAEELLPHLAEQAVVLQQKYDVVITNPPYMSISGMGNKLSSFTKKFYPDSKNDMFSVFIEHGLQMIKANGYQSMITQHAWMFLTSYEKLRIRLLNVDMVCLAHLGIGTFEDLNSKVVQSVSFIIRNSNIYGFNGVYDRLFEKHGLQEDNSEKQKWLRYGTHRFISKQDSFSLVPGKIYAYWMRPSVISIFSSNPSVGKICAVKNGMSTTDNNRFLRQWYECQFSSIGLSCSDAFEAKASKKKWFPYNKGGDYRKYYGNIGLVVNWQNDGQEIKKAAEGASGGRIVSQEYYFRRSISWSKVSSGQFSLRMYPTGFLFDVAGPSIFADESTQLYILGLFNSKIKKVFLEELSPTINYEMGQVSTMPIVFDDDTKKTIENYVRYNVERSKIEWDSYETSWDFQIHPLLPKFTPECERRIVEFKEKTNCISKICVRLSQCFIEWENECQERFSQVKANEEEINRIYIDIYGLQDELTPEVADKDVTIRKADLGRDIRSLISYAVGCMFGRYSLDVLGLAYAGGEWDPSKYVTYPADPDGILPITDEEYFQDDIVSMFVRWVKAVYGEETLEENLQFIANTLNPSGNSAREVIRSYFLNDFFSDHLKVYQKRPIYWQFDSGKQNGFKALMYLHRYDQDTVARLRTDYVHELQDRYRTQLDDARKTAETGDARQRSIASKRAQKLDKQLTELNKYEELVHHYADMRIQLDLDDGVKVNYAKLQEILTPIK